MFTKQKLFDDLQEIKTGLDSLMKLVSDFDQVELEDELGSYFESIIGKISFHISFAEDLFTWKQRGITIQELIESLEMESLNLFAHRG